MAKQSAPSFEDNLTALEDIVAQLESGQLNLDDAMKVFEKGIQLTRDCQKSLAEAEQKVQVLVNKDGQQTLEPLPTQDKE